MAKKGEYKLTQEEIDAGVTIDIPLNELEVVDVSNKAVEKMARGFILGSKAIGNRSDIRSKLEEKVTKKIGVKGKYLVDKLFELIEGIYIVDKKGGKEIRYYQIPPSLPAITYALDRVLGKPVVRSESMEEKKGVMVVEHIIRNLAGDGQKSVVSVVKEKTI